jgi:hypothetical protein
MMKVAVFLAITALVSGGRASDPLWQDDYLIWDMDYDVTWMGDGHVYCDAQYDPNGTLYATAIMERTIASGDLLNIYVSQDDGQTWAIGDLTTGGSWDLYDTRLAISDGPSGYLLLFYLALKPGQTGMCVIARYQLPGMTLVDGYVIDYSNPAADDLRSQAMAVDPVSGTIWHFSNDILDQLFLTKSTDDGVTWSASELVATGVARPRAVPGPGGRVYLAYQETTGAENVKCMVFTDSGHTTCTVGSAAADAAPIPASEWSGAQPEAVGIVYHDQGGNVILRVSEDYGSTWSTSYTIGQGSYPFIDVYPSNSKACMAYVNQAGTGIMTAHASGIPGLGNATFEQRTDQTPSTSGPPVVRYNFQTSDAEIYGLFYLGTGPRDLWYDNSVLTGIGESSTAELVTPAIGLEPNPFSGSTTVRVTLESTEAVEIGVYSMDGRLVEHVYSGNTGSGLFQAGGTLPAGAYTVVMTTGSGALESVRMVKLD